MPIQRHIVIEDDHFNRFNSFNPVNKKPYPVTPASIPPIRSGSFEIT